MSTPLDRGLELLAQYSAPAACAAEILCDRHDPDQVAFTLVDADLSGTDLRYGELRAESTAVAAGLAGLGVGPGDRVATLLGKGREYLVTVLAIWRLGAVHVPLFTAFAPAAIAERLEISRAKVVVCDPLQRPKLDPADGATRRDWRVVLVREPGQDGGAPTDVDFAALAATPVTTDPTAAMGGDAPMVLIYTSGTTGRPKGVVLPLRALATWQVYLEYGLYVTPDDVYWCVADPGWTYGLYSAVLAPMAAGRRSLFVRSQFHPATAWQVLGAWQVTNVTAAPTVYRAMRAAAGPSPGDLAVRRAASAGEPLTAEVNQWAPAALGAPVHDHYGQTEAGMLICNHHHPGLGRPLRAGSMGHSAPGWSGVVLHQERDEPVPPGTPGRIAFDLAASPMAWFDGYLDEPEKSAEKFTADRRWYLTGDTGSCDEDGYLWFKGRDDDVILMAGYRIGPFDVESVLLAHPAVAECAVIAVPDEIRGEVIEAFVVVRGSAPTGPDDQARLADELRQWVRSRYAAHAYPRTVHFIPELPKTHSGKVQRHLLRRQRREQLAGTAG